ncbi:MAG: TolC family outer membrane protein [Lautropia sp.]|nr:TolC family outer membrane protein [Lautropia sp.]
MATAHDPAYLKAQADYAAIQESLNISRAALLPNIAAEYRHTPQHSRTVTARSPDDGNLTLKRHSRTHSASLTFQQPLFDLQRWNQLKQSEAQALAGKYSLMEAAQNLMVRVFDAYIETLYAKDQLHIARSQYEAYAKELKRNRSAFKIGDATRTDVSETEAQLRAAAVSVEDANDVMLVALQKLSQITGAQIASADSIASIKADYLGYNQQLQELDRWKTLALKNNWQLLQARESIQEARLARKKVKAEYIPTISLVAEHTRNVPRSDELLEQRQRTSSIGVLVSVPLYSGGATNAAVRQVSYQIESKMREAEAITHDIMTNLTQNHRLLSSGMSRIQARRRAVQAAQTALSGNRAAVIVGDRINSDVLDATQRLYAARSALQRAVYDNLKAIIALKYYAGILGPSDILDIDQFFEG